MGVKVTAQAEENKWCGFTLADVWSMSNTALAVQTPGAKTHNLQCDLMAEGCPGRETTAKMHLYTSTE